MFASEDMTLVVFQKRYKKQQTGTMNCMMCDWYAFQKCSIVLSIGLYSWMKLTTNRLRTYLNEWVDKIITYADATDY